MDKVVAIDVAGGKLPEQVVSFVQDLNWLRDEGFIEMIEDQEGNVRIIPAE